MVFQAPEAYDHNVEIAGNAGVAEDLRRSQEAADRLLAGAMAKVRHPHTNMATVIRMITGKEADDLAVGDTGEGDKLSIADARRALSLRLSDSHGVPALEAAKTAIDKGEDVGVPFHGAPQLILSETGWTYLGKPEKKKA